MTGELVVTWILISVCGYLGYRIAVQCRKVFGVSPWRVPPLVWGLVCAFLPLVGIMLETIAQLTTKRSFGPNQGYRIGGAPPGARSATGASLPPGGPRGMSPLPGEGLLVLGQPGERRLPGPSGWRPAEAGEEPAGLPPLFGWYPDPTGRFSQRYWDGRHWSERVMKDTTTADDPL